MFIAANFTNHVVHGLRPLVCNKASNLISQERKPGLVIAVLLLEVWNEVWYLPRACWTIAPEDSMMSANRDLSQRVNELDDY